MDDMWVEGIGKGKMWDVGLGIIKMQIISLLRS